MINDTPLAKAFWERGRLDECPVYDMHGHMGHWHSIYFPRAEAPQMVATMDEAGVRMLLFAHHASLFCPELGNAPAIEAVRAFPDRLRAYCSLNPNYPDAIARDVARFDEFLDVFVGFKTLADYHGIAITDDAYRPAWELANARELLVLNHTWAGSQYDGPEPVRRIVERYPNVRMLLGHSLHGDWGTAIQIAKEHPNVFLELTAILDDRGIIEMYAEGAGSDRMLFGTDLPWFDPHHGIGAILSADITDEDRHNIFHRNAEKLLAPFVAGLRGRPQAASRGGRRPRGARGT